MRLLEVNEDGELTLSGHFYDGEIPKYAILSHTWGKDEDEISYRDVVDQEVDCDSNGYKKIMFCTQQAKADGLRYFWIDTCAIDKDSSAELSEAINSMFDWYKQADFSASRWFTRGWTLQELLAPPEVEFFSREGTLLGTKTSLKRTLHKITGIPLAALEGAPLSDFSVDDRLAWAKKRETKRVEDRAYCLMGLFDVQMPLLYGEKSEKAFRRLLEEITKPKSWTFTIQPGGPSIHRAMDTYRHGDIKSSSRHQQGNNDSRTFDPSNARDQPEKRHEYTTDPTGDLRQSAKTFAAANACDKCRGPQTHRTGNYTRDVRRSADSSDTSSQNRLSHQSHHESQSIVGLCDRQSSSMDRDLMRSRLLQQQSTVTIEEASKARRGRSAFYAYWQVDARTNRALARRLQESQRSCEQVIVTRQDDYSSVIRGLDHLQASALRSLLENVSARNSCNSGNGKWKVAYAKVIEKFKDLSGGESQSLMCVILRTEAARAMKEVQSQDCRTLHLEYDQAQPGHSQHWLCPW